MSRELLLTALVVLAALLFILVLRRKARRADSTQRSKAAVARTAASALRQSGGATVPSPATPAHRELPVDLAVLAQTPAREPSGGERSLIMDVLRNIPRPPRSLYELTSAEFMGTASSAEIAELVSNEPLVAAQVMGKVHSPMFGLRQPVRHLGQAITFMGMQNVRAICLRYLMSESFASGDPQVKQVFDNFGEASTVASEICLRMATALRLPDPSSMRTVVILSFTGHLAAAVLLMRASDVAVPSNPGRLLQRVMQQRDQSGLAAPEIGRLLMTEWSLPPSLIASVASIDRVLTEPASSCAAQDRLTNGLCYLSARIAERLVMGEISGPADIERFLDHDPDFFHVGGYLDGRASVEWRSVLLLEETTAGLAA